MTDTEERPPSRKRKRAAPLGDGPYVLRTLLDQVPLSADGSDESISINCVEYLNGNLYVGTSASELLHFVQIPPDPAEKDGRPVFILASRLKPAFSQTANSRPGVTQILLLPTVDKACVLCNWTVTFYSLPELSPVFGTVQVKNCSWIGGVDLNAAADEHGRRSLEVTFLLSLNRKIQVVRIGEDARVIKKIDFAGSTVSVRRDSIACVADSKNYALLDVDRQLKIPLMTISSLEDAPSEGTVGQVQSLQTSNDSTLLRSHSSAHARSLSNTGDPRAHNRSTSLGDFISGAVRRQDRRPGEPEDPVFQSPTPPPPAASPGPPPESSGAQERSSEDKPLPPAPGDAAESLGGPQPGPLPMPKPVFLKPHITSPTPEEFLLVTGTGPLEPGIGMFVNLDGDPTRPTIEFERYPDEVVVDPGSADLLSSQPSIGGDEEGYVLASMSKESEVGLRHGLEVQRFSGNPGEGGGDKYWLEAGELIQEGYSTAPPLGIRSVLGIEEYYFQDLVDRLCQKKFRAFADGAPDVFTVPLRRTDSRTALSVERVSKERELFERDTDSQEEEALPEGWETKRNTEEEGFVGRLAKTTARVAVWTGNHIWWAVRNPLLLQLEAKIDATLGEEAGSLTIDERHELFTVLKSIRQRDAKTELEFITFRYIRQRAGVLLLTSFLHSAKAPFSDPELRALEEVLAEGGLDPRVILSLMPCLRNEIIESRRGIWVYGGVKLAADRYIASDRFEQASPKIGSLEPQVLLFAKRFLAAWRRMKGFGSVADERDVFRTVDATLLAVLLELDRKSPRGLAKTSSSIRSELYELVDRGVDCFDRAVTLLESYHRLFVLSRLYQSRKMAGDVLATWRRIIEGERDDGGELADGEQRVREYLMKISNQGLVQEYGLWLANRNPRLGVQVFAEDRARAAKFEPAHVVALLREEAPDAVRYYLEHLVFGKGHTAYVNELIAYYLDVVISDLQSSQQSRETISSTYESYKALEPPKPTYRQFITENAPPDDEVWHSRLRLLQLLGGAHGYDASAIRSRITQGLEKTGDPELLVPESIILDGQQGHHLSALRLLVHRLGDYDTAVSYCLRGGSSFYTPPPSAASAPGTAPDRQQQTRLFSALLREFFVLEDVSDRVVQTGALLERFGGWFDVREVLELIPDHWSVDVVADFLAAALQRLVRERHETAVAKALSSVENLRVSHELISAIAEKGPHVEAEG